MFKDALKTFTGTLMHKSTLPTLSSLFLPSTLTHLIWSAWMNHMRVNKVHSWSWIPPLRLARTVRGRKSRKMDWNDRRREQAGKNWEEKMDDEGDGGTDAGMTGKGVRWQVGRDGWKARGEERMGSLASQNKLCGTYRLWRAVNLWLRVDSC